MRPSNVPLTARSGQRRQLLPDGLSSAVTASLTTPTPTGSGSPIPMPGGRTVLGDGLDYQYLPNGTQTGETIDLEDTPSPWQGDGTYNARTGMIWQSRGFAFESHRRPPVPLRDRSGRQGGHGQPDLRSLDRLSAGRRPGVRLRDRHVLRGRSLGVITHVDNAGNLLDSGLRRAADLGARVQPDDAAPLRRELFAPVRHVRRESGPANTIVLSGFSVKSNGVPVLNSDGVSLEADCIGHLWVLRRVQQRRLRVRFGRARLVRHRHPVAFGGPDVRHGSGPGHGRALRSGRRRQHAAGDGHVRFGGPLAGASPAVAGLHDGHAGPGPPVPVDFTVLFNDVPKDSFAGNYIYGAAGAGVMPGCAPNAPAFAFCPAQIVTRRSMAGYLERAVHGALTPPPVYPGEFDDVLLGSFNADYIQGLVEDGITAGCSSPRRCTVRRLRSRGRRWRSSCGRASTERSLRRPARRRAPSRTFRARAGSPWTTSRASTTRGSRPAAAEGDYCPDAGITNAQMAVFLVKAFEIPYLP